MKKSIDSQMVPSGHGSPTEASKKMWADDIKKFAGLQWRQVAPDGLSWRTSKAYVLQ